MFDYQTSIHPHFDTACRRFSLAHNLTELAAVIGISARCYVTNLTQTSRTD